MTIANARDKFLKKAGAKVNAAMGDLLKSGNRNQRGLQWTADRILKSAENSFFQFSEGAGKSDPVKALYKGFSDVPGLENVGNVAGVDVVDINIAATQQSVLGYIVAERGMDKPIDTLWFEGLKALNNIGGYEKGNWVNRPYMPISNKIRSALRGAVASVEAKAGLTDVAAVIKHIKETANVKGDLVTNSIQVLKDKKVVGKYVDGEIYFSNGATLAELDNTYTIIAGIDRSTETDGANTLKVKPGVETLNVVAEPRRIHLEQSYEENSYMNKQAFQLSQSGITLDYGRIAVNQLLETYVKFLDIDAVMTTAYAISGFDECPTLDMTDYLMTTSEVGTKNDIINASMLTLNSTLMQKCGMGYTAILVDTVGAQILGNNKDYFEPTPAFTQALDGLVGSYSGIPVIRHHALDGEFDSEDGKYGVVFGIHKAADGSLAPAVYAEYLPPYSCAPALNFNNAAQFSQSLLSMSACKAINEDMDVQLGAWMKIKVN